MTAEDDPVREWLYQPIPRRLWHYTNSDGFAGMVRSGRVWATEVRFQKDEEEFIHAKEIAESVIRDLPEDGDNVRVKKAARDLIDKWFETGALSPARLEVYAASFTVLDDAPSQWRGYGDSGRGFSLGFDLRQSRPPSDSGYLVVFAPCVYEESEKRRLISAALNHFVSGTLSLWRKVDSPAWVRQRMIEWEAMHPVVHGAYRQDFMNWNKQYLHEELQKHTIRTAANLLSMAALCKRQSFREEQEWRLVLPVEKDRNLRTAARQTRMNGPKVIPYLTTTLPPGVEAKLPLEEVVRGPCNKSTDVKDCAAHLLCANGYSASIRDSEIPTPGAPG
jgi:hypothetical protein